MLTEQNYGLELVRTIRQEMRTGFVDASHELQALQTSLTKIIDDHEARIRGTENTITRVKGFGLGLSGLATVFGVDVLYRYIFRP